MSWYLTVSTLNQWMIFSFRQFCNSQLPREVLFCISFFQRCVSMNSLSPGTSTRHVGITVVSADCVKPIEGATLSQFCETFSNGRLNDVITFTLLPKSLLLGAMVVVRRSQSVFSLSHLNLVGNVAKRKYMSMFKITKCRCMYN